MVRQRERERCGEIKIGREEQMLKDREIEEQRQGERDRGIESYLEREIEKLKQDNERKVHPVMRKQAIAAITRDRSLNWPAQHPFLRVMIAEHFLYQLPPVLSIDLSHPSVYLCSFLSLHSPVSLSISFSTSVDREQATAGKQYRDRTRLNFGSGTL